MNKHQKKIYKLTKVMFLNQLSNNPKFHGSFPRYYKLIKWLYAGKDTSEKELEETLRWARYVNSKSKYKLKRGIKK